QLGGRSVCREGNGVEIRTGTGSGAEGNPESRDLTPTPLLLWRTSSQSEHTGFISRGNLAPEIPFALSPIRQYWIRVMFDVLKAQLTAAGEKLAHLRRFL